MHPAIPHLIELQRVDHQIAVLRAELEGYPKRIREAETKLGGARVDVASAKEAHAQITAERKKFEFDAQQWKDRARKYRDQSGAVKTNEAFKALQHEIVNAEAEVAKADDRQLEVMIATEEVERRVKIAESRLKEAEQVVATERKEILAQGTEKKKQLEAATAEHGMARKSESLRPVSRTYCTPMVTVRLGRNLKVSPRYACMRVSPKAPQGEPNPDFSLKQLEPFPRVMLSTG